ncbi:unnamed protein product, partial [Tetraodon nigroviridis]
WLKVFALKRDVVGIRGVQSGLYLCLGADGAAFASVRAESRALWRDWLSAAKLTVERRP